MLVARQQQMQDAGSSVSLAEVLALREDKATSTARLTIAQQELTLLKVSVHIHILHMV